LPSGIAAVGLGAPVLELSPLPHGKTAFSYLVDLQRVLAMVPEEALGQVVNLLLQARSTGHRVYIFGNGGSAATASHLACDLMKTAHVPPLRALRTHSIMDNLALLTAHSNDHAYESAIATQLDEFIEAGDVVIAISASGRSRNIVEALEVSRLKGAHTVGLLGFDGGPALGLVDVAVHVPVHHYGLAEDAHSAIGHALTMALKTALEQSLESRGPASYGQG
jgi:D-sedoheptulose 7-phosphate isomerase